MSRVQPYEGHHTQRRVERAIVADYAAVPLDLPLISNPRERVVYNRDSLERIQRGLARALENAQGQGWIDAEDEKLKQKVAHLIDLSLTQSHVTRLFLNRHFDDIFNDPKDPRVIMASKGTAMPNDLLSLLIEYPDLYSVELAKLSHPLDVTAPARMDQDVTRTIISKGGELLNGTPKYKPKTRELDIPGMTVLRKRRVGRIATRAGEITVMSRQAFLLRGDEAAREEVPYIDRKIKNESRFDELEEMVEDQLPGLEDNPGVKWVQPIATSYYAKYPASKKQ